MQEIQEIQKLIKEQSDKGTLARFDVRDYEFRRVMKKENRADIVQAYDSAPDIVAQTAIGKTWAKERTGYDYDYDASLFSNLIYQAAMFPEGEIRKSHGYEYQISYDGIDYRGDTMCSWSRTVNKCLNRFGNGTLDNVGETLSACITGFMQVVYTIGNFVPVPFLPNQHSFNFWRNTLVNDYWDLSLYAIYRFYTGHQEYYLNWPKWGRMFQCEENEHWLEQSAMGQAGWDSFVEKNFMQPFTVTENGSYGPPVPLWDDHFLKGGLPQNEDEFRQFFTNATERILARGELIAKKVKETSTSAQ